MNWISVRIPVLVVSTVLFAAASATSAQQAKPAHHPLQKLHVGSSDVAAVFSLERAQVAQNGTPAFWLKGGSLDGSLDFFHGLGLAANLTVEHKSDITPGVSLGKFAYMFGPRYTVSTSRFTDKMTKKHPTSLFGEALFGGVHGYDAFFPVGKTTTSSANAFSMQLGGGVDLTLHKGFGIRALEMDFVHTSLPNNAGNSQNDFRIAFGVSYRR